MRILILAAMMALSGCAAGAGAPGAAAERSPFPVHRGDAMAPPSASAHATPPEGVAAGGLDFGAWRQADPVQYAPQFESQVRARFAGRTASELRAGLEANGFLCEDERRLDCRIEIMESGCAYDWYVVLERGAREPVAGFEHLCLGAR
ncbi:MAG: hypothetical protein R3C25_04330 [Hyphomonadaceae bacterium]